MIVDFSISKVIERDGVVRFIGATSDDRVDLYNTRCTKEIFQDWIINSKSLGYPWLTIAHYPREVAHVGDVDEMWIESHYFKVSGLFLSTELANKAAQSLLNDREGKIRLSSGFVPTDRIIEPGNVTAFTKGYLQHCALTTHPANLGAYVTATIERSSSHFIDASSIVGDELAYELERKYAEYMIDVTGQHISIPRSLSQWERLSQLNNILYNKLKYIVRSQELPIICSGDSCSVVGNQGAILLGPSCLDTDELDFEDPLVLNWAKAIISTSSRSYLSEIPNSELLNILTDNLEIRMEIKDISSSSIRKESDDEIISLHWRLHQLFAQFENDRQFENLTKDDFEQAHKIISAEMIKRGLKHNVHDHLDELSTRFVPNWITGKYKSFTVIPEYVSLAGSSVRSQTPNDIDIIIRKNKEQRDTSEEVSIRRQLDPNKELDMRYVYAPTGPHGDFIPLFDLTLTPIKKTELNYILPGSGITRSRTPSRPDWIRDFSVVLQHIEGQEILEMGCGDGYGLSVLEEAGYTSTGIDMDDSSVENCHQLGLNALQGSSDDTALKDKSFDTVFSSHMLEHLENPWDAIAESVRLARRKAFHIVPLGHRLSTEHKWEWYSLNELSEAFPDCKVYAIPNSDSAVLVPLETMIRSKNLKPLIKFRPTKTGSSYAQQEYQDVEKFYEEWGKGYIEEGIPLDVEIKYNGWRLVLQSDGESELIYFEDSKKDRTQQFSSLVEDLKSFNKSLILDAELGAVDENGNPIARKDLAYWGGNEKVPLNFTTPGGVKGTLICHVFDILYYDGEDLHDKPWKERRKILEKVMASSDTKVLTLSTIHIVRTKDALIKAVNKVSKVKGSEGAVVKSTDSTYNITGNTTGWSKIKLQSEFKVQVKEKHTIKGGAGLFGYSIQYLDSENNLQDAGRTMNTVVDAKIGNILTISVQEIIPKKLKDNIWGISIVVPKVRDIDIDRNKPDSSVDIIRKAEEAGILQLSADIEKELKKDKVLRFFMPIVIERSNITFKSGMKGNGVLQLHERGLTKDQALIFGRKFFFGLDPIEVTSNDYSRLNEIVSANWSALVKQSSNGDSSKLLEVINKIDREKLSKNQRLALGKVEPVSIHCDLRLHPDKEDWWEGGEFFTPGNQFQENRVLKLDEGISIQMDWKKPRKEEGGEGTVRGPISWLHIGTPNPTIFPPNTAGATSNAWGRMTVIDKIEWESGTQDNHYKEFLFKGKILNGRYIMTFVPVGDGRRIWMIKKPKKQELDYKERIILEPVFETVEPILKSVIESLEIVSKEDIEPIIEIAPQVFVPKKRITRKKVERDALGRIVAIDEEQSEE